MICKEIIRGWNSFYPKKSKIMEELHYNPDSFNMHKLKTNVLEIIGQNKSSVIVIIDGAGNLLLDINSKKEAWRDYISNKFADRLRMLPVLTEEITGPPILKSEVLRALTTAKTGKFPGLDNIHIKIR